MTFTETDYNKKSGWIKLHRSIRKHWVWENHIYFKIWCDFLLRANHKGNKVLIDANLILVKRGEFITSQLKLAKEYKTSRDKIRNFINLLESDQMITLNATNKFTKITICNYDSYQDLGTTEKHQKNNRKTSKKHQKNIKKTQTRMIKNVKNVKNDKEERESPLSQKEFDSLILEWNAFAEGQHIPKVLTVTEKRKRKVKKRLQEQEFNLYKIFDKIKDSEFLRGENDRGWKVDFDFVFNSADNYLKILEGKYNGTATGKPKDRDKQNELRNIVNSF